MVIIIFAMMLNLFASIFMFGASLGLYGTQGYEKALVFAVGGLVNLLFLSWNTNNLILHIVSLQ